MSQWAQQITEQYLAEQIKQNPQNIWELFPRDKELVEEVDQEIQQGELLASEAEELVRNNTAQARNDWVQQASHDLVDFIVAFETGRRLEELLEKIRRRDKKAALMLARAIDPGQGTPAYEALMELSQLCSDDGAFLSALDQAREQARKKEMPEARRQDLEGGAFSTRTLIEIFFWITFNQEWLREELGSYDAAYAALVDHFGKGTELPSPESFRGMLQLLGVKL